MCAATAGPKRREALATGARHLRKAQGARLSATSTRQYGKKVFFTFWTDWLVTSSRWRLELDIENLIQNLILSYIINISNLFIKTSDFLLDICKCFEQDHPGLSLSLYLR
jgi:hypothetical protein